MTAKIGNYDKIGIKTNLTDIINEDILYKAGFGTKFYEIKTKNFCNSLKNPESGVKGFLRPVPEDVSKQIYGKRYKRYIDKSDEYNYDFFYFTPVHDDVRFGAIIAVDKSKVSIPHTYRFYEIYGEENKALEWAMDFSNVIEVNSIVPKRIELENRFYHLSPQACS
jgi:hypothetical protein